MDLLTDGWPAEMLDNPVDPVSLHFDVANDLAWSRANLEESAPGVTTPLSWAFVGPSSIVSSRITFGLMGLLSRDEFGAPAPTEPDDVPMTVFFGRQCVNVDFFRRYIARVPGANPDDFERDILGSVRPDVARPPRHLRRAPIVLATMLRNANRAPAAIQQNFDSTIAWWRQETAGVAELDLRGAIDLFDAATRRHAEVAGVHVFGFLVGQGYYSRLTNRCREAGLDGLELVLSGGGEGTIELEMVDLVAEIASGQATLQTFLDRFGYRGPNEGEISATSWREDPTPVERMVELYHSNPQTRINTQQTGAAATRSLVEAVSALKRRPTAKLVERVQEFTQVREIGKSTFIACRDVGRAAARRIGDLLVEEGRLDDRDDVFMLTRAQLDEPGRLQERVAVARAQWLRYGEVDVPDHFVGVPEPTAAVLAAERASTGDVIEGVGVSAGIVEGTARVVIDPAAFDDFEVGDILVCELTDPAWAPLMQLSGGIAIDIGGALSHGAIVARELGIPAVIATGNGTARIADGAVVRLDGTTGTVTILS